MTHSGVLYIFEMGQVTGPWQ